MEYISHGKPDGTHEYRRVKLVDDNLHYHSLFHHRSADVIAFFYDLDASKYRSRIDTEFVGLMNVIQIDSELYRSGLGSDNILYLSKIIH